VRADDDLFGVLVVVGDDRRGRGGERDVGVGGGRSGKREKHAVL
jgi:hypothetical protein